MQPAALAALAAFTAAVPALVAHASDDWTVSTYGPFSVNDFEFGPASPPVSPREFELYTATLRLDADQLALAGELYADFAARHREMSTLAAEQRADRQAAAQFKQDWQEMQQEMTRAARETRLSAHEMSERFFDDLRLIINSEQEAHWDTMQRDRRRRDTLTEFAAYPMERIDLVSMIEGLDMPESFRASLAPTIEQYQAALDGVLVLRNREAESLGDRVKRVNEFQSELFAMYQDPDPDHEKMMQKQQQFESMQADLVPAALGLRNACRRVRDVNLQYSRELEQKMPSKMRENFQAQLAKAAGRDARNPMNAVFNEYSRARIALNMLEQLDTMRPMMEMQAKLLEGSDRMDNEVMASYLDAIRKVEPLTADQKEQIAQIKADFEAQEADVNTRYGGKAAGSVTDRGDEPDSFTLNTPYGAVFLRKASVDEQQMWGGVSEDDSSPNRRRAEELLELNQRTIDRLRSILTLSQRSVIAQF